MGGKKFGPRRYDIINPSLQTRVDPETKEQVREYAQRNRCHIAQALRELIEFGLEAARSGEPSKALHSAPERR